MKIAYFDYLAKPRYSTTSGKPILEESCNPIMESSP